MSTGWTGADIPDLSGRVMVVTGANSGLGLQTSRALAEHGATVVMACRDPERGAAAFEGVRRSAPTSDVHLGHLDLADLASVRRFAAETEAAYGDGIDVLVNNAGVMATPRRRTADGFELQLGTNHLGHFALSGLLLPLLRRRPRSRVVTVSSNAHRSGRLNRDDLMGESGYQTWRAYGQSKLANLLFAMELDRRARAAGSDLLSVAAHPGWAATSLQAAGPRMRGSRLGERWMGILNALVAQSDANGALPQLYAATMPDVVSGEYFGPDGIAQQRGHPKRVSMSAAARDAASAGWLWEESQRLTGVTVSF